MIDALSAARHALAVPGLSEATDNTQLFITGYSQGGYVAMATQRAMQAAGMSVTAAAPLSGPYALSAFFDAVMNGQVDGGAPVFMTLLLTAYQKAYGNIYVAPTEVFEDQYASGIDALLPTLSSRGDLYATGRLPQYALFSATPPDPRYAAITPAHAALAVRCGVCPWFWQWQSHPQQFSSRLPSGQRGPPQRSATAAAPGTGPQ